MKPKGIRSFLLVLAATLFVFTTFITLPHMIPTADTVDFSTLIWSCSSGGRPKAYYTIISQNPDFPQMYVPVNKLEVAVDESKPNHITVSGYLMYADKEVIDHAFTLPWWSGLPGRKVTLTLTGIYNGKMKVNEVELKTGSDGYFTAELDFSRIPDCYRVMAHYEGEILARPPRTYMQSKAAISTCESSYLEEPQESTWWRYVLAGLVVVIFVVAFLLYLKRKQRRLSMVEVPAARIEEFQDKEEIKEKVILSGGDIAFVRIIFSDIDYSLPPVWGTGVELRVAFITDNDSSSEIIINWGDEEKSRSENEKQKTELVHIYKKKGEYTITSGYKDKSGKEVSSWRTIQIVDYREEMVRLFGEMLETLNLGDVKIEPDMTPREVEKMLSENLENIPKESLRRVIDGFEEANYSTHPVNRESYVRMYKAIREVREISNE